MENIRNIEDEYNGAAMIERRLCKIRVLVVMDDVDQLIQLENLAGSRDWFGPGSRILITTPAIWFLRVCQIKLILNLLKLLFFLAAQKLNRFLSLLEKWSIYRCFVLMELLLKNYLCQLSG